MTRKADICPVCGRRGKPKWYKAQNAIVKKFRKLGRKADECLKGIIIFRPDNDNLSRIFKDLWPLSSSFSGL